MMYAKEGHPEITIVENGIILPAQYFSPKYEWGLGGIVDEDGRFIEESATILPHKFGGWYEFDKNDCDVITGTVVFLGPIKTHWGHFLIDMLSRCWYLKKPDKGYKIAYCGFDHEPGMLTEQCIEIFNLLGIEKSRLLDIRTPSKVSKIIIPEITFVPGNCYYKEFLDIFDTIISNIDLSKYPVYEKVYFTRTDWKDKSELGEKTFEEFFRQNGYEVISPQNLSVKEQIAYVYRCRCFASVEGTIAHNIIFARNAEEQIILRKHTYSNSRQYLLNDIVQVKAEEFMVSQRVFKNFPRDRSDCTVWLRINVSFLKYVKGKNMKLPSTIILRISDLKYGSLYLMKCMALFFGNVSNYCIEINKRLKAVLWCLKYENIIIYGAGSSGKKMLRYLQCISLLKNIFLVDANYQLFKKEENVKSLQSVMDKKHKGYIICLRKADDRKQVREQLIRLNVCEKDISEFGG